MTSQKSQNSDLHTSSIHLLHSLLEDLYSSLSHSVRCWVVGHGSDVMDPVLFEEIFKLFSCEFATIVCDDNCRQTVGHVCRCGIFLIKQ